MEAEEKQHKTTASLAAGDVTASTSRDTVFIVILCRHNNITHNTANFKKRRHLTQFLNHFKEVFLLHLFVTTWALAIGLSRYDTHIVALNIGRYLQN